MTTETPAPVAERGFEAFALSSDLLSVLKELGYEEPTPIQRETIPHLLAGRDVLGQAATGTGKTAAFALPLVERLEPTQKEPFTTRALVLVPTRELAMQVAEAVRSYGKRKRLAVAPIFGGQEIFHQVKLLKAGVDVVVATPGRVLDHVRRKTLKLGGVRFVVLDEADEMLDMGFAEDLDLILSELPDNRQTALFSATMAPRIAAIANEHLDDPIRVTIAPRALDAGTLPKIRQAAYVVRRELKEAALIRLLDVEAPGSALIFCRTRIEVEALTESLGRRGLLVSALHGGMTQEQRDLTLRRFKTGELKMLIATDVAARGIHVEALSHVINFDLPVSPEPYVHRIGRTGRAGREGVALSLLDPREMRLLKNIERITRSKIPLEKVPGAEAVRKKREGVLAEAVKAALQPRALEHMKDLLAELAEGTSLELVAAAALQVAMSRLFPPTEGDEVDFAQPPRRPDKRARDDEGGRGRFERDEGPRRPRTERPAAAPLLREGDGEGPAPRPSTKRAAPRPSAKRVAQPVDAEQFTAPDLEDEDAIEPPDFGPPAVPSTPNRGSTERRPFTPEGAGGGEENHDAFERRAFPPAQRQAAPSDDAPRGPRRDARADARPFKGADRRGPSPAGPRGFDGPPRRGPRAPAGEVSTLFIGLGARAGLRPQDVVGAIANEAGLRSRDIGGIVINDENAKVEVPKDLAGQVISALRQTTLRGRKFAVDYDRSAGGPRARSEGPPSRPGPRGGGASGGGFRTERFAGSSKKPPRFKR